MVCFNDLQTFKDSIKPSTKIVWAETPTNPTLKIVDIAAIAKICKEKNIIFVVDNTFCTPYLQVSTYQKTITILKQNPLDLGADIVVHSVTKYIGGHSDVVMGGMCMNDKELYDRLFFTIKSKN